MDGAIGFFAALGVIDLFFLLGRELICWYFKVNQIVALLEDIRDSLKNKSQ